LKNYLRKKKNRYTSKNPPPLIPPPGGEGNSYKIKKCNLFLPWGERIYPKVYPLDKIGGNTDKIGILLKIPLP
jgi:hypothetical protein